MTADSPTTNLSVLGAGSWGTALALLLANNLSQTKQKGNVALWGRDRRLLEEMERTRCNTVFLPKHNLPRNVHIQTCLPTAVAAGTLLILATPSQAARFILEKVKPELGRHHQGLVLACKGLEAKSGKPMHEVVAELISPDFPCAYLAGPSFAPEVAAGMPTLVTVVSEHDGFAERVAAILRNDFFRVYTSGDVIGAAIAGAIKNVIAIAAGVADGLGFGVNARAALISRGLREMSQLAVRLGAQEQTMTGLAGLGDLVLTCTSHQSRNYRFGLLLAQSQTQEQAHKKIGQVVEGAQTAPFVCQLARSQGLEMPICRAVSELLRERLTPRQAARSLLRRAPKTEN